MNILFILPEYYPHSGGGISTYYLHYINALKPFCKRIKAIVGSGYVQSADKFDHNGIEVEYLDPELYHDYLHKFTAYDLLPAYKSNLAAAWAMWQQANNGEGFDIIECTDFGLGFTPWVIHHQKPLITRMHGSTGQIALHENDSDTRISTDTFINAELALLPLCDRLITHSAANRDFWRSILPHASIEHIRPVFQTEKPQLVAFADRDKFGLVTARIQKWKGPEVLCEAIGFLKEKIEIKWFGRDTVYDNKITTAQYLTHKYSQIWGGQIITSPPKPNAEIQFMQQQAKFGLIPSVWDMFNFTCLEFMAAGTPVICSDGAGVVELIEHGKNGYKYNAAKPKDLAECIESVAALSPQQYEAMALAGQQTVADLLSAEALMPLYMQEYNAVMAGFKPSTANAFLSSVYAPSAKTHSIADILDKQPLKKLMAYIKKRLLLKVKNR
ncbi:MAG: glycosyltransferase family 4 protein [Bacteroidota bacterium]